MIELRGYQLDAIEQIRTQLRIGKRKVLVVAPTGSGKTVMFARLLARAAEKGSRALVLAHRRELIQQTSEKLHRFGARHGVIQAGFPRQLEHAIQVASVQTLVRNLGMLGQVDIVVIDEAHHYTTANSYAQITNCFPKAVLLGWTATPWRLDGAGLADVFDGHVIVRTPRQLRDEGFLVPVTGYEYSPIDTRAAKVSGGDFTGKSLEAAATTAAVLGDVVGEWKQHAGDVRTVLFACTIAHSQAMAEAFRKAGVKAEHLDGETPDAERAGILKRIKSGETRVLCNVNVATEGWDCPELECAILARPTLSTVLALQMCGRILRPCDGKPFARIHDHARVLATHGHPYAERDFSPEKSTKAARSALESGVKRGLRCAVCKAVIDRYPCSGCGHKPTANQLAAAAKAERRELLDTPEWNKIRAAASKHAEAAAKWKLHSTATKKAIFDRLQRKLGTRGATGAYRRMSGETEWPPQGWRLNLEPAVYR